MKRFTLGIILLLSIGYATAQNINKARFRMSDDGQSFHLIELLLDKGVRIGISDCSKIEYIETDREEIFHERDLEKLGLPIKYYNEFDMHDPRGKIKSIGNIVFKYNNSFDIHEKFGTLKSVGNIPVKYYNTFDMHDPQGKIKSVGQVQISYYNSFETSSGRFGDLKFIKGNNSKLSVVSRHGAKVPLQEDAYIPEIPSQTEVKKEVADLREMDEKLLKKIEELSLYIIDLKKEVDALKQKNQLLELKLSSLN